MKSIRRFAVAGNAIEASDGLKRRCEVGRLSQTDPLSLVRDSALGAPHQARGPSGGLVRLVCLQVQSRNHLCSEFVKPSAHDGIFEVGDAVARGFRNRSLAWDVPLKESNVAPTFASLPIPRHCARCARARPARSAAA